MREDVLAEVARLNEQGLRVLGVELQIKSRKRKAMPLKWQMEADMTGYLAFLRSQTIYGTSINTLTRNTELLLKSLRVIMKRKWPNGLWWDWMLTAFCWVAISTISLIRTAPSSRNHHHTKIISDQKARIILQLQSKWPQGRIYGR